MGWIHFIVYFLLIIICLTGCSAKYYGKLIGQLKTNAHGVKGTVYAASKNSFYLVGFEYDGQGPDAFFWVGTTPQPSVNGSIVPNEKGLKEVLKQYNKQDIIISLPDGKTIKDIKWLSVWCRMFAVDFGSVLIPDDFVLPGELNLGPFPSFAHNLRSGNIIIKDSKTVYIPKLFYDGAAPDAFFLVGKGNHPHSSSAIKVPDENGRLIEKMMKPESQKTTYYGKYIGDFNTQAHGVKGKVYAASDNSFFIKDFSYDGQGPKGHFWAGDTAEPSPKGYIVLDEFGTEEVLREYKDKDIIITLPEGKKIKDIKWLSVWCEKFSVNFGSVEIPENFQPPEEKNLGPLPSLAHGVKSGPVIIKNIKTIFISNLYYDGAAPDAFFLVGKGNEPHGMGTKVPDENGSLSKLKGYTGKDVLLTLPGNLTIFDIEWFGLYCIMFSENFGHVRIPRDINVPPDMQSLKAMSMNFDNCEEIFPDKMHVRWNIFDKNLYVQLVGKVGDKEYMAFGLSGKEDIAYMIGSDIVLVYYDKSKLQANAVDYYITSKAQCSGKSGVCPDTKLGGTDDSKLIYSQYTNGILSATYKRPLQTGDAQDQSVPSSDPVTVIAAIGPLNSLLEAAYHPVYYTKHYFINNSNYFLQCSGKSGVCPDTKLGGTDDSKLIYSQYTNGILSATYKRPLQTGDAQDQSVPSSDPVTVIAAIGPLNSLLEAAYHPVYYTKQTIRINFGRNPPMSNCGVLTNVVNEEKPKPKSWSIPRISDATTFTAQIGPAGGEHGYKAITGHQPWGITWWINGILIPELVVVRGQNYTFIVEGGNDPTKSASYHPLYITNNNEGGGSQFLETLGSDKHKIYAGTTTDAKGNIIPIGVGRYCEWKHKTIDMADQSPTFESYKETLELKCEDGEAGKFTWTPDEDTPDIVYYQCFTHRNLGWKIFVTDGVSQIRCIASIVILLQILLRVI
ncbi:protein Skeletor, isoforms B/C-like [Centruroides sculpturatus]|uniref:protein Skeletor, isoforms B/C-like n=1 Tax=Centruroides sculpturatus TaxID=218467 RepID=UPI000C6E070F|nr:protein Skeletor, isoforms B/C-like [Centruroides sculpturatus]